MDTAEELTAPVTDAIDKVVDEQVALTAAGVAILIAATFGVAALGYFGGNRLKRWNEDRRRRKTIVLTQPAPPV